MKLQFVNATSQLGHALLHQLDFAFLPYFTEVKNSYELSNVAEVDGLDRVLRT